MTTTKRRASGATASTRNRPGHAQTLHTQALTVRTFGAQNARVRPSRSHVRGQNARGQSLTGAGRAGERVRVNP